jgi:hypothetical protein
MEQVMRFLGNARKPYSIFVDASEPVAAFATLRGLKLVADIKIYQYHKFDVQNYETDLTADVSVITVVDDVTMLDSAIAMLFNELHIKNDSALLQEPWFLNTFKKAEDASVASGYDIYMKKVLPMSAVRAVKASKVSSARTDIHPWLTLLHVLGTSVGMLVVWDTRLVIDVIDLSKFDGIEYVHVNDNSRLLFLPESVKADLSDDVLSIIQPYISDTIDN